MTSDANAKVIFGLQNNSDSLRGKITEENEINEIEERQ
jgi:hypothetical protein